MYFNGIESGLKLPAWVNGLTTSPLSDSLKSTCGTAMTSSNLLVATLNSYAASRWTVLGKLRVPASLPYLFAAFKIAATACVVGAIIGELPASIQDGLGGAILNFNQYYASSPESLWATNIIAALLGIAFFLLIVLTEKLVVRRAPEHFV